MSLQIQEKERKCIGCESTEPNAHMFRGTFFDEDLNDWVEEIYCNECLANILTEEPEIIGDVEAI